MKNLKFLILPLILITGACADVNQQEPIPFEKVVENLQKDQDHAYLKTLRPNLEEVKQIFKEDGSAQHAFEFSERKWNGINVFPHDGMKPNQPNSKFEYISLTKEELSRGETNGLPDIYTLLADHLKDGTKVYIFQIINEDGSLYLTRDAFFKLSDKWIFLPNTYQYFYES